MLPAETQISHSRRDFIKRTGLTLGSTLFLGNVLSANQQEATTGLKLAWVGVGTMGLWDLRNASHGNQVVAICDCDERSWEKAKEYFPDAIYYKDFRIMLREMGAQISAVGVSTPDHNHFAPAYMAMSMGKHVFVEKPLTNSIHQARVLETHAKTSGVITQMGNQGHASNGARLIKEWYEAGLIGKVREVIAWTNRPARGGGFSNKVMTEYPKPESIPDGLDWDLWLGTSTENVGYSKEYHYLRWRSWWAFGCGGLGDIGCHTIDTAYWALNLGAPESIEVEMQGPPNPIYTPNGSVVKFNFPARGDQPPVSVKWYEGPTPPEVPADFDAEVHHEGGMIMVGENGGIHHRGMRPDAPRLYPEPKWEHYRTNPDQRVPQSIPRTKGIFRDWMQSIETGELACSDFSYAAPLTEVILLGTLAIRTGKGFRWDAENMKIIGNDAADQILQDTAMREGWRIEDLT